MVVSYIASDGSVVVYHHSKQSQKGSEQIWSGNSRPERNLNGVSTWKGQNREHREAASKPVMQNNSSKGRVRPAKSAFLSPRHQSSEVKLTRSAFISPKHRSPENGPTKSVFVNPKRQGFFNMYLSKSDSCMSGWGCVINLVPYDGCGFKSITRGLRVDEELLQVKKIKVDISTFSKLVCERLFVSCWEKDYGESGHICVTALRRACR
ncbi:unnamed protein product [Enterobius vermicularis]|uniref:Transducin/WD40 repeat-like superfamily protein n=1 Tax=Enterobius vermicularis TaxID=51028 RepID=A0A0N4VKX5_ENTVE|nr:unnamed protein product [Enterobius vermicularis]